jgi:hypothetical protein
MGCFVKRVYLENESFPKFNLASVKYGLTNITDRKFVRKAFNLEDQTFKDDEREVQLKGLIENFAIPFLLEISTEDGIREAVKKYDDLKYMIDLDTKAALAMEVEDDND